MRETTSRVQPPVLEAAELLKEPLSKACHRLEVAGAIRRRRRDAQYVDFLAIPKIEPATLPGDPDFNFLWAMLDYSTDQPWHGGFLMRGDKLRSFVYRLPEGRGDVTVNIYTATMETWGIKLINHTGPGAFWATFHSKLQAQGYMSNNGVVIDVRTGDPVPTKTEHDVFMLARYQYREPWARDGGAPPGAGW